MQRHPQGSGKDAADRDAFLGDFERVRRFTERLCEPLETEDFLLQTVVETSPPRWHLAHVSWFFETFLLRPFLPGYRVFHELCLPRALRVPLQQLLRADRQRILAPPRARTPLAPNGCGGLRLPPARG